MSEQTSLLAGIDVPGTGARRGRRPAVSTKQLRNGVLVAVAVIVVCGLGVVAFLRTGGEDRVDAELVQTAATASRHAKESSPPLPEQPPLPGHFNDPVTKR